MFLCGGGITWHNPSVLRWRHESRRSSSHFIILIILILFSRRLEFNEFRDQGVGFAV